MTTFTCPPSGGGTGKSGLCVTHTLLVPPPLGGHVKVVNKIRTLRYTYLTCASSYTLDKVLLQKTPFDVYFLGMIEEVNMGNSRKRDTEAQLVDRVEEAQVCASSTRRTCKGRH
jgi:hypothetical protein